MLDYSDIPSNTTALFEVGVGQVWARQKKVCHKKNIFFLLLKTFVVDHVKKAFFTVQTF